VLIRTTRGGAGGRRGGVATSPVDTPDRVAAIGFGFSGTILNQASIYLVHFRVSQSVSQFRRGPRAHHTTVYYYFIVISLHNSFPSPPSAATAALADQRRGRGKPETFCRHRWARRALSCGHSARYSLTGTFQSLASRSGSVGLGVRSCTPVSATHSMSLFDQAPHVHAARQTSARMGCIV